MRVLPIFAVVLALSSAQAAETIPNLTGSWRLERLRGVQNFDPAKTEMRIGADGAISTTVGCNRASARARFEGDRVSLGPLATTRLACPPELAGLEVAYFAALEAARSFLLKNSELALLDEKGEELAGFVRK
jgi:heat shock protein HslJ